MWLPCIKFTDLKCIGCSKFGKFHLPKGVLDQVDPKFDVDSNVDCPGDRRVFLITNLGGGQPDSYMKVDFGKIGKIGLSDFLTSNFVLLAKSGTKKF